MLGGKSARDITGIRDDGRSRARDERGKVDRQDSLLIDGSQKADDDRVAASAPIVVVVRQPVVEPARPIVLPDFHVQKAVSEARGESTSTSISAGVVSASASNVSARGLSGVTAINLPN
ncbi:MAG: hypothetical protein RI906_567 [Pseudomonadota bacterium]